MKEYRYKNAIIRMHGEPNKEKIKEAAEDFMRKVIKQRKLKEKENENS